MRVLQFRMLCDSGGVSSSMLLLGRQMARRGIDAEYWFCQPSNRLHEFMQTGRATLAPLAQLAPRLARGDFDVVHMTATDPAALFVARMAKSAKVVVTARGALADIWTPQNCFAYTAISHGMAAVNQPYTSLEIEVVRNAIETGRFAPPASDTEGPPIVAFVGRSTSPEKDFPRFTRIAKRLVDGGARVWIADPHEASWDKFAGMNAERLQPERWGPVPNAQMPDFYRAVASSGGVVLMTSRTEGFGNVAPEAAACGARVAAPDVMGLREAVIDGVTGKLFGATASDDDVASMLREWMAARHDVKAVADAARREFSPTVLMDKYQAIYERKEQRIIPRVPAHANTGDLDALLQHLDKQRRWRANFGRATAADLAAAGYAGFALDALRNSFRASPRTFLSAKALKQVALTGVRVATSSRRA